MLEKHPNDFHTSCIRNIPEMMELPKFLINRICTTRGAPEQEYTAFDARCKVVQLSLSRTFTSLTSWHLRTRTSRTRSAALTSTACLVSCRSIDPKYLALPMPNVTESTCPRLVHSHPHCDKLKERLNAHSDTAMIGSTDVYRDQSYSYGAGGGPE
jgi:hypothetical protein